MRPTVANNGQCLQTASTRRPPEDDSGLPCSGKPCLQRLCIQLPSVFGAQQLQATLQSVVISVSQHESSSGTCLEAFVFILVAKTIRLLLVSFSPVWWPPVILLLPGVALLSWWIAKKAPKSASAAPEAAHRKPGKQRVPCWGSGRLRSCDVASDNLGALSSVTL